MHFGADLFVASAFKVTEADDLPFPRRQFLEELLDLLKVLQPGLSLGGFLAFHGRSMAVRLGLHLANRCAASELMHTDAPGDDGQISRQTALAAELAKDRVIAGDELQQNLSGHVLNVFRAEHAASQVGGMVNDVINEPEKTVDKIVPGAPFVIKAPLQQSAVNGG